MFTILNRLRGEYSIFAKINGILLGALFGALTGNLYIAVFITIGYIAGESMGWGDWIGQLITGQHKCGNEGKSNGIKWMASKFTKCGTKEYNELALVIRGIYWWLPALAPLFFVINPVIVLACIAILAVWFPISILLAKLLKYTGTKAWQKSEYIYGFIQDICILVLVLNV